VFIVIAKEEEEGKKIIKIWTVMGMVETGFHCR
jgi:hypothetical protein